MQQNAKLIRLETAEQQRLVASVHDMIWKLAIKHTPLDRQGDEVSLEQSHLAGYVGACRAAVGFEPERGLKFTTYAWPCITHAIGRVREAMGDRPELAESGGR